MGKHSSTTVQSYKPTEQEMRLQQQAADYADAVAPNALNLNDWAYNLLKDSLGTVQIDYGKLNNQALGQIGAAQQGVADLTQGKLPQAYTDNMQQMLNDSVQKSLGGALQGLSKTGVLNSSVTNTAMDNISKNAMAQMSSQYLNNINTLNGLYGQQSQLAGKGVLQSAASQEAAQQPALNLWNASLGLNQGGTLGALSAIGKDGSVTTKGNDGGGGFMNGLFGLGQAALSACFTGETYIRIPNGIKEIQDVKEDDEVLCYNPINGKESIEKVVTTSHASNIPVYQVVCTDDDGNEHSVCASATQPFLKEDGTLVDIATMRINEKLQDVGIVTSIAKIGEEDVYDFATTGSGLYYAQDFISECEWE